MFLAEFFHPPLLLKLLASKLKQSGKHKNNVVLTHFALLFQISDLPCIW